MRLMLLVALGSGAGGALRYLIAVAVAARSVTAFPVATLAINVVGSLLLGALMRSLSGSGAMRPDVAALLGVGFCGGFTTFSAFSLETVYLVQAGALRTAAVYVAASVVLSLLAAYTGWTLGLTSGHR